MENEHYDKSKSIKDCGQVSYESLNHFKKRYPQDRGGYKVVGAIGSVNKQVKGKWMSDDVEYEYYDLKYSHFLYGIIGYVEIEENTFVAIVGSKLPIRFVQLAIIACLIVGGVFVWNSLQSDNPIFEPSAGEYKPEVDIAKDADTTSIQIPGYGDIRMQAGTDVAYIALWNPNTNPCYFQFRIVLDNGNKTIYESKLIKPGYAVTTVNLNQRFEQGKYPITIQINTYKLNDYKVRLNGGEIKTNLVAIEAKK